MISSSTGGNAFLKLKVGRQLYLSNKACKECVEEDGLEELWITILPETRVMTFPYGGKMRTVRTRVMEEYETVDGELEEVSRNFVADCNPMHDVYYFGEEVFDGDGNPLPDAWLAGVDGAKPGILMPDRAYLLGSRYFQEFAPNAKDRGEHTSLGFDVEVPAGYVQELRRGDRNIAAGTGQRVAEDLLPERRHDAGRRPRADQGFRQRGVALGQRLTAIHKRGQSPLEGDVPFVAQGSHHSKGVRPLFIQSSSRRSFQFHHLRRSGFGSGVRAAYVAQRNV